MSKLQQKQIFIGLEYSSNELDKVDEDNRLLVAGSKLCMTLDGIIENPRSHNYSPRSRTILPLSKMNVNVGFVDDADARDKFNKSPDRHSEEFKKCDGFQRSSNCKKYY